MPVLAARSSAKMSWLDHEVAFVQSLFLNSFMVARYAGPVWLIQQKMVKRLVLHQAHIRAIDPSGALSSTALHNLCTCAGIKKGSTPSERGQAHASQLCTTSARSDF